jgi:hypothetical protein
LRFSLLIRCREIVREERQKKRRERGVNGRRGVHRRRRICPVMFAETTNSDDESRRPGGTIGRGKKGRGEREARASYRHGD